MRLPKLARLVMTVWACTLVHLDGCRAGEECGISQVVPNHRRPKDALGQREGRIVNGRRALGDSWPWQVSVRREAPDGRGYSGHWCGGVLVAQGWVLTAAHCLNNTVAMPLDEKGPGVSGHALPTLSVAMPSEGDLGGAQGRMLSVESVHVNKGFQPFKHDIALLKLNTTVQHQRTGTPVCLPTSKPTRNESFEGIRCLATGWGQSRLGSGIQQHLQQVELTVIDNRHCQDMYGVQYNIKVQDFHLCAGPVLRGGKGTCVGDSGGPLHCNMKDGRWYLAGLTSFGSGCAKPGFPDVFMRITSYTDWIEDVVGRHSNKVL